MSRVLLAFLVCVSCTTAAFAEPVRGMMILFQSLDADNTPACTAGFQGAAFYSTDYHAVVYCDGTEWRVLSSFPYAPERMGESEDAQTRADQ